MKLLLFALLSLACLNATAKMPSPVHGWRGDFDGIFEDANPPLSWSTEESVLWKTKMPSWTNALPLPVGDLIITHGEPDLVIAVNADSGEIVWQSANGYEDLVSEEEAAKAKEKMAAAEPLRQEIQKTEGAAQQVRRRLQAIQKQMDEKITELKQAGEKENGEKIKAIREEFNPKLQPFREELKTFRDKLSNLNAELNEADPFRIPKTHQTNGFTSSSPVTDGEFIYSHFGNGMVVCHDLEGNRLWGRVVQKPIHPFGHCATPLLAGDTLVVQVEEVFALDKQTGETKWQQKSPHNWGSPLLKEMDGKPVVVVSGGDVFDLETGEKLNRDRLVKLEYNSAMSLPGDIVYFIQHNGAAYEMKMTDQGQISRLWVTRPDNDRYYSSPVLHDGIIYAVNRKGILSAIDANTGEILNSRDLGRPSEKVTYYPSICLAGGKLFISHDAGKTFVLEPSQELEIVGENELEPFRSTPVFVGNRIYIRTLDHLWAFGS